MLCFTNCATIRLFNVFSVRALAGVMPSAHVHLVPRGLPRSCRAAAAGLPRKMPPPSLRTWPGSQDGFGRGGLRLKWAKGRFGSKIDEKVKVLRMGLPIVENLSGPQESIFNLSRSPQLHCCEKSKV